jgi:predicted small secreted protein
MKRFALLFVALVLAIPVTGCGGTSGSSPTPAGSGDDSHVLGEAKAYKAKEAERLAERAEKAARAKTAKTGSKNR